MRAEKSSLASGRAAVQLTHEAMAGFATAASLIKEGPSGLDHVTGTGKDIASGACSLGPDNPETAPANGLKPKAKRRAPAGDKGVVAPKKPRAPRKVTDRLTEATGRLSAGAALETSALSVTEKKPRKPRLKKDIIEGQPKIRKGKITKPGTEAGKDEASVKRKRSTISSGAVIVADSTGSPDVVELPSAKQGLGLDKAILRRKCWTPPKETNWMVGRACEKTGSTEHTGEAMHLTSLEPAARSLGALFLDHGYVHTDEAGVRPKVTRNIDSPTVTKRRRIEVCSISN